MSAVQKRWLCSSTAHITQKYWASPLSKSSSVYNSSCYKENITTTVYSTRDKDAHAEYVFNTSKFLLVALFVHVLLICRLIYALRARLWSSDSLNSHMTKRKVHKEDCLQYYTMWDYVCGRTINQHVNYWILTKHFLTILLSLTEYSHGWIIKVWWMERQNKLKGLITSVTYFIHKNGSGFVDC